MQREFLYILQALVIAVLVPAFLAATLGSPWGRHRGKAAQALLFGVFSCLGAVFTGSLSFHGDVHPLAAMIQAAREAPPEVLQRELPPHLSRILVSLAHREGRQPRPEEIHAQVTSVMQILMRTRSVPEEELDRRMPGLVEELVRSTGSPRLVEVLTASHYADASLGVVIAAGLHGGPAVGLIAGLAGVSFRRIIGGISFTLLIPTLLAGIGASLLARGRASGSWSSRAGFGIGFGAGVIQFLWSTSIAVADLLSPGLLVSGGMLALLQGIGLAFFVTVRRLDELEERERRAREGEVEARLALLSAQIRPHFLFNALNALSASCGGDGERTRHLIACLARFLRLSLRPGARLIPLGRELEDLEAYLELERARFADRLEIEIAVEEEMKVALVPPLILQPLVENAITHGFRPDGGTLRVEIRARKEDQILDLVVEDDGIGVSVVKLADLQRGEGGRIGLRSARERLDSLSPPGRLLLDSVPGRSFRVQLRLPIHRDSPGNEDGRAA